MNIININLYYQLILMSKYTFEYYIKKIDPEWIPLFDNNKDYLNSILDKLSTQKIYPHKKNIFKLFEYIKPTKIKCVIIGQDPYINCEIINNKEIPQAEGLSFSVPKSHKKNTTFFKKYF